MSLTILGFLLIFLATTAGSALVYFFRRDIPKRINAIILGFAAGVMIAASVWSLLIPSIDAAESAFGSWAWVPAAVGFLLGGLFLVLLDHLLPHFHAGTGHEEGPHLKVRKSTRLFLAVTIDRGACHTAWAPLRLCQEHVDRRCRKTKRWCRRPSRAHARSVEERLGPVGRTFSKGKIHASHGSRKPDPGS